MKSLGWFVAIALFLVMIWFVIIVPAALSNMEDGFKDYHKTIPIKGSLEDRRETYDGVWSFSPLKVEMQNLHIQGNPGEWNKQIFFNPDLHIEYVRFKPVPMMKDGIPEVTEIGYIELNMIAPYPTLMKMLSARNERFKVTGILYHGNHQIEIIGVFRDLAEEIRIRGSLKVDMEGNVAVDVLEVIDGLNRPVNDLHARRKILGRLDLTWHFKFDRHDLVVEHCAVGEVGFYVESGCDGWKAEPNKEDEETEDESSESSGM